MSAVTVDTLACSKILKNATRRSLFTLFLEGVELIRSAPDPLLVKEADLNSDAPVEEPLAADNPLSPYVYRPNHCRVTNTSQLKAYQEGL